MNLLNLTDEQSKALDQLCKIVNFGADCLENSKIDRKKIRIRKKLFLLMMSAAHNYTEGIYELCKQSRTHSCFVLMRSLIENRINAKSLFASKGLDGVYGYLLESYNEEKKMLERMLELKKRRLCVPMLKNLSEKHLNKKIKSFDKIINTIKKKYPESISFQKAYNRAEKIDEFNRIKKYRSESLKVEYESFYRLYSSNSHLTLRHGLDTFISVGEDDILEILLSGDVNDLERILQHTFYFYQDILRMFLIHFKSPFRKELKNYL
ncbi:MAG: hypothetical protein K940chlam8_00707 [Chlamydiae bacterium]|nr:hypothetical protein [Chlamydiota bacterium]